MSERDTPLEAKATARTLLVMKTKTETCEQCGKPYKRVGMKLCGDCFRQIRRILLARDAASRKEEAR